MKEKLTGMTEECNNKLEECEQEWREKLEKEKEKNSQTLKENKVIPTQCTCNENVHMYLPGDSFKRSRTAE